MYLFLFCFFLKWHHLFLFQVCNFLQRRRVAKSTANNHLWIRHKGLTDSRRAELKKEVDEHVAVHPVRLCGASSCQDSVFDPCSGLQTLTTLSSVSTVIQSVPWGMRAPPWRGAAAPPDGAADRSPQEEEGGAEGGVPASSYTHTAAAAKR